MAKPAKRSESSRSRRIESARSRGARIRGGRAKKISITVDDQVLRTVRHEIRGTGRTLSAHITEALARDIRRRRLQELIEQHESEHGAITEEELARARERWQA